MSERNEMFLGGVKEFLEMCIGRRTSHTCTLADGVTVLEVLDACRESNRSGCEVVLQ